MTGPVAPVPPIAKRVETRREYHGDVFIDPYEWLRRVAKRLVHLHAKDISIQQGGSERGKVTGTPVGCACALFSASKQGKRTPLPDVRSFAQSARLQNRRMGTQSGPSGLSAPVLGLELPLVAPGRVRLSGFSSEAALGLAKRWQFDWRTALEPRAPSSVS